MARDWGRLCTRRTLCGACFVLRQSRIESAFLTAAVLPDRLTPRLAPRLGAVRMPAPRSDNTSPDPGRVAEPGAGAAAGIGSLLLRLSPDIGLAGGGMAVTVMAKVSEATGEVSGSTASANKGGAGGSRVGIRGGRLITHGLQQCQIESGVGGCQTELGRFGLG